MPEPSKAKFEQTPPALEQSSLPRVVKVQFAEANVVRDLELYNGMSREDIYVALRAAAHLSSHDSFILTNADSGAIVPVSAALPGGMEVILRATSGNIVSLDSVEANPKPRNIVSLDSVEANPRPGNMVSFDSSAGNPGTLHTTVETSGKKMAEILPHQEPSEKTIKAGSDSSSRAASEEYRADEREGLSPHTEPSRASRFEQDMVVLQTAVAQFAKVGNYQANERTFLAWERTALASLRTVFSLLSLSATIAGWKTVLEIVTVMLACVTLMLHFVGHWRFFDIRRALDTNLPPDEMVLRARTDKWASPWKGGPPIYKHLLRVDVSAWTLGTAMVTMILAVVFKGVDK